MDNNKQLISRQFKRVECDGQLAHGFGIWENMPDEDNWDFVCEFLPDYQWNSDVTLEDDIQCLIDKEKTRKHFNELQPECKGLHMKTLIQMQKDMYKQLFLEAQAGLAEAIEAGAIVIREFPVTIVSAKPSADERVLLIPFYDEGHEGRRYSVSDFQQVQSRIVDGQFQIRNPEQSYTPQQWLNANAQDFQ